jgi:HTH-type transcriptional regulator/antitoxin HipB
MPFKKADMGIERKELDELLQSSEEARAASEIFEEEYRFRLLLATQRKSKSITQQNIEDKSGLTQQVISRIEKMTDGRSPTLRTVLRYLNAIDCELTVSSKKH